MRAEIIAIGDELVSGQRLDTNSRWISSQLCDLGIQPIAHTTVADDLAINIEAFRTAANRADVIICTGGLGPTKDDLTRQSIAEAFDKPLILDEAILEKIRGLFTRRNREMPANNRIQAMFPQGSQVIPNPHGSAPGIDLQIEANDGCRILALPGVPAEMKQMWALSVVPRLDALLGTDLGALRHHTIKMFGIGESDVEMRLPELIARGRQPQVGITVSRATISLRIAARAKQQEDFDELIRPTRQEIETALGDLIFGSGEDELEHSVSRLLAHKGMSLSSVEIGAASWINDWMLTAQGNQATTYRGGLGFSSVDVANQWVDRASHEPMEKTTDEFWSSLVRQVREEFRSDLALGVGVYPSYTDMENSTKAFEPVFVIASQSDVKIVRQSMGGHPDVLGPRIGKTGLDHVRRWLMESAK